MKRQNGIDGVLTSGIPATMTNPALSTSMQGTAPRTRHRRPAAWGRGNARSGHFSMSSSTVCRVSTAERRAPSIWAPPGGRH